jgi:catechol 2,3-dioxygenase-like lactoylglutathione lyase family enzyme
MPLDHISLRVSDYTKAIEFYQAALAPLGYVVVMEFDGFAGMGAGKPDFWVTGSDQPINPTHIAFVTDRQGVDAFHVAAVAAGGKDNGAPGPRTEYHPHYYGAFVLDADGNNIEACCHTPDGKLAHAAAPKPRAAKKPAAPKPAAKKAPAKKPATKKPAAKKPAPKKTPARKPARRK